MSTPQPLYYKNMSRCVIIGCKSKGLVCHRFPNANRYLERLLKWIDIIGLDKSDALSIYQKKVICADHFEDSCSSPGTKSLNVNAYPTLNLPGQQLLPVEDITVPANVSTSNVKIHKVADINVSGSEVADIYVSGSEVNDLNVSGCELFENEFENTPSNCKNLKVSPSVLRVMNDGDVISMHVGNSNAVSSSLKAKKTNNAIG
ncbi:unnamed protein product [Macrosiphum euphorbiae]|uniref:THAP-type domain-containing protein n=1 Tax=Macrosiphum euphorbiae TaxID=13131 RepID=A0AAV0XMB6_9HEMI|nr:unnamed protein product [Macrosiphum euphorbiae]